eukprot:TRINITY_DN74521_c0_g1_i1.p1 TRINITY_DN74521_c0_g1~~TRINITY_DN74521_c0_g1_i1.p1  ORF type:complete len:472 (+),score=51.77 TRINITY_DN74521_c0_g1_i1:154-1569(+)
MLAANEVASMDERSSEQFAVKLDHLHAVLAELREEVTALRECLVASDALRETAFLVQLHRRRFAAAKAAYPCAWESCLSSTLRECGTAIAMAPFLDGSSACAVGSSSSELCLALRAMRQWARAHVSPLLYMCGGIRGEESLSSAERYDLRINSWEALPPMVNPRNSPCAAVIDGCLIVCGGFQDLTNGSATNTVECFDPSLGSWRSLPSMHHARAEACFAFLNKRLYVFGGISNGAGLVAGAESYAFGDAEWQLFPMFARHSAATAAMLGRIYICGGWNPRHSYLKLVESYNPDANAWNNLPPMSFERADAVAVALGSSLYVCGGFGRSNQLVRSVERFDIATHGSWELLPEMMLPRALACVAVLHGKLYVFGGHSTSETVTAAVERFDPAHNRWMEVPSMACARKEAGVAVLRGKLYVCGGDGHDGSALDSAECFDPEAAGGEGAWQELPAMFTPRSASACGILDNLRQI